MVRELKKDPGVDNPWAVAWAQHNKEKKANLIGKKVLAIRKGGVAEGVVLELLPLGDLMADFGEGPEEVAGDMVLEPELDLDELEVEELDMDEEEEEPEDDTEDEAPDDASEASKEEPQVLVITVEDALGL
jgi:hypothetical protein